jgi:hypothetical protein
MQSVRIVRPPTPYPGDTFYEEGLAPVDAIAEQRVCNNNGVLRMESEGQAKIKIMDGDGRFDESYAKWGLTYNNDAYGNGGVDGVVESNKNGEKQVYEIQIPNDELYKIFSSPPQRGTLDDRLIKDFSMTRRRGRKNHDKNHNNVTFVEPIETIFESGYQGDTEDKHDDDDAKKELQDLMLLLRRGQPGQPRTRRMRIQYSSEPMKRFHRSASKRSDRKRSSTSQRAPRSARTNMGRRRTNKLFHPHSRSSYKMKKRTSSLKRSSKSNLPLTEIND